MEPLQLLVDGLALGGVYALAALGFVLILNGLGAANLAHGSLVTLGGFIAVGLGARIPSWSGFAFLPVVAGIMALAGLVVVALLPAGPQRDGPENSTLATFALGTMITAALSIGFGTLPVSGPRLFGGGDLGFLGLSVSRQSLVVALTALAIVPLVHLLLTSTQFGRRLRAAGQDPDLARALGIDTRRMAAATFALGAALAGIAGLLLADRFTVAPAYGLDLLVKAYIAVAIAGWGQVGGSAAIAVAIALVETVIGAVAAPALADATVFAALLCALAVQPQGLFGPAAQRRA